MSADFNFDHPIWKQRSRYSQQFIASLLRREPTKRPDAKRALKHSWFKQHFEVAERPPFVEIDKASEEFEEERRDALFKSDAINVSGSLTRPCPGAFSFAKMILAGPFHCLIAVERNSLWFLAPSLSLTLLFSSGNSFSYSYYLFVPFRFVPFHSMIDNCVSFVGSKHQQSPRCTRRHERCQSRNCKLQQLS